MILIVDDDRALAQAIRALLKRSGYECALCHNADDAVDFLRANAPELILMDMNFSIDISGREGLSLLRSAKIFRPEVPVILMTAWGNIDLAVEGIKAGASDFLTKPWDNRRLLSAVDSAIRLNATHKNPEITSSQAIEGIVGQSEPLHKVFETVRRVASTDAPVLITGESGTGKELIARAIHNLSRRSTGPFIKVNLGGMPVSLFESEMFGYVRGAFTGAVADREGRFEAADGGTIFLDEIGELDAVSQVKLLRVLQEQTFEPLGSSKTRHSDFRVISATNAALENMVAARTFREDLFYRINLVRINVPPLRERGADIDLLAHHFLGDMVRTYGLKKTPTIADDALAWLHSQPFPGNIRELKNIVERTALLYPDQTLRASHFQDSAANSEHTAAGSDGTLASMERMRIESALRESGGNISAAAHSLGISRPALYRRMQKFGL